MPRVGKKILYALLGFAFTALGIIGVWVPGLPTTVFILLAMWAFSNSSQRLHAWLIRIPILHTAVKEAQRFQREGTVDARVKIVSQTCAWLSFIGVTIALQNLTVSIIVGLLAVASSVFMYIIPTTESTTINED